MFTATMQIIALLLRGRNFNSDVFNFVMPKTLF